MQDPSASSSSALLLYSHIMKSQIEQQQQGHDNQFQQFAVGDQVQQQQLKCPRCESSNTKFCYYNNYNLLQPRHYCKNCRRYWTKGGTLRNIPVGGASRTKSNKTTSTNNATSTNTNNNNTANKPPPPPRSITTTTAKRPHPAPASISLSSTAGAGAASFKEDHHHHHDHRSNSMINSTDHDHLRLVGEINSNSNNNDVNNNNSNNNSFQLDLLLQRQVSSTLPGTGTSSLLGSSSSSSTSPPPTTTGSPHLDLLIGLVNYGGSTTSTTAGHGRPNGSTLLSTNCCLQVTTTTADHFNVSNLEIVGNNDADAATAHDELIVNTTWTSSSSSAAGHGHGGHANANANANGWPDHLSIYTPPSNSSSSTQ